MREVVFSMMMKIMKMFDVNDDHSEVISVMMMMMLSVMMMSKNYKTRSFLCDFKNEKPCCGQG